jgi:hypothetical protein
MTTIQRWSTGLAVIASLAPCVSGPLHSEERLQTNDPRAELFGCGPADERHDVINPNGPPTIAAAQPDKALIYVVRRKGARFRYFPQNKLGANGRWVAVLKRGDYTFFTVDPGQIKLCYTGDRGLTEGAGFLQLKAEAGRTYYLRGDTGAMGGSTKLMLLDEEEGRALVGESKSAAFKVKP